MCVWERICLCEREKKRELLECSRVDEALEKKRKKKSEDRDKGEDKQVGYVKAKLSRDMCLRV